MPSWLEGARAPFAFLTGALLFDAVAVLTGGASFAATATHLTVAGIATGVLAAIPGAIDYFYTVPPASSGKAPGRSVVVGHVDDLKENQMKLLRVNGQRIVLARTSGGYHACADRCSHRGGSLAGGVLVTGAVHCLWHRSQFDVATGRVVCGPASEGIQTDAS